MDHGRLLADLEKKRCTKFDYLHLIANLWINVLCAKNQQLFDEAMKAGTAKRKEMDEAIKKYGYAGAFCRVEKWPEQPKYNTFFAENSLDDLFDTLITGMEVK